MHKKKQLMIVFFFYKSADYSLWINELIDLRNSRTDKRGKKRPLEFLRAQNVTSLNVSFSVFSVETSAKCFVLLLDEWPQSMIKNVVD